MSGRTRLRGYGLLALLFFFGGAVINIAVLAVHLVSNVVAGHAVHLDTPHARTLGAIALLWVVLRVVFGPLHAFVVTALALGAVVGIVPAWLAVAAGGFLALTYVKFTLSPPPPPPRR